MLVPSLIDDIDIDSLFLVLSSRLSFSTVTIFSLLISNLWDVQWNNVNVLFLQINSDLWFCPPGVPCSYWAYLYIGFK